MTRTERDTPASTLPTAFLLLAEAALTAGGHNPSTPHTLAALVADVQPILSLANLSTRAQDLIGVAMGNNSEREASVRTELARIVTRGHVEEDDYYDVTASMTTHGIHIGLVAGYLLAQMVAGKDGGR